MNIKKHVDKLIETVAVETGKAGRPRKNVAADEKGMQKRTGAANARRNAPQFQVERTFSWLQRKFWRLVVRWERLSDYFDAFFSLALVLSGCND